MGVGVDAAGEGGDVASEGDDEDVCEEGVSGECSDGGVVAISSASSSTPEDGVESVDEAVAATSTTSLGSGNASSPRSCTTLSAALR